MDVIEDSEGALVIYSTEIFPDEWAELVTQQSANALKGLKEYLEP